MTRYLIGIDLGTTNSALAYVDLQKEYRPVQMFSIPQFTLLGKVGSLATLPSFCYLVDRADGTDAALHLPWKEERESFVGQFAKIQGAKVPTRLVQSAKSWLCNSSARRKEKILPTDPADPSQQCSPVEASAKYLMHLKDAWNASMAKNDPHAVLEDQEVVLTVPASFDEVSRALTVEAAHLAGLRQLTLIEEPQAAFYSWISQNEKSALEQFQLGDTILVCDIGGGTTDFSLIVVDETEGTKAFQRMAVGDHLLLGGDNMDAAIAHFLEAKLLEEGHSPLEATQWHQLIAEARTAKETLMQEGVDPFICHSIVIQGLGASVLKGSLITTISRQEIERLLVEGFFSQYPLEEALRLRQGSGFKTMGLPYEEESSITKQMAHFLYRAKCFDPGKRIDYILFNGGAFKAQLFQRSLVSSIALWYGGKEPVVLLTSSLDLSVARGAAYYGKVRHGLGLAIKGGAPRAYYLEIELKDSSGSTQKKAMTLIPRGSEEGYEYRSQEKFFVRTNTPVLFHLWTSHVRLGDSQGEMIDIDENELHRLPRVQTVLRIGKGHIQEGSEKLIPAKIALKLTPTGIVELWLESEHSEHRWNLEFQLKSASGQDSLSLNTTMKTLDETFDPRLLDDAKQIISTTYQQKTPATATTMVDRLEKHFGRLKKEWSVSLLRGLCDALLLNSSTRKNSSEHECRWWNLLSFCMRPGHGFPLDDYRVKEIWKIILGELKTPRSIDCQIQQWICFRRIAGGLSKGQQMQLSSELMKDLFERKSSKTERIRKGDQYPYSEKLRALASLERIDVSQKIKIGQELVWRMTHHEAISADYWALARIGARHLMDGSIAHVVSKEVVSHWIESLLSLNGRSDDIRFVMGSLARKTTQREINISESLKKKIIQAYPEEHLVQMLDRIQSYSQFEQEDLLGDQLPPGLIFEAEVHGL